MSNVAQRSFASGELAPSLYARTDFARYVTGLRTCRNFICLRDGGAANRPGTEFVGLCPTGATLIRTLPFVFNDAQSYVLEFSHLSLRIIQNGAYIGAPYVVASPYLASELRALQITQSADVMTIVHPSHPVYELRRLAALVWTLAPVAFGPGIAAPAGVTLSPAGSGTFEQWVVTAISESTGAESYASTAVGKSSIELPAQRSVLWSPVPGAVGYNIYKAYYGGGYGFVGTSPVPQFYDQGLTPDFLDQPPANRALFAATNDYPSAVANAQQRRLLAGTNSAPETFWASRTADLNNFTVSKPVQDDDAITATLISKKVNAIRHLVDADVLYVLTSGGEWVLRGDTAGILRPTDINGLNFSKHGASLLPPIVVDRRLLYVQARQSIVREVRSNDVGPGYEGANLTLSSTHLFKGYTLVDWAYQEEPHSTIWLVRSDGTLLGLTYLEEQKVLAWHRHDTDGLVESVCVIPEGDEDRLYLVVNRNGVRMIERMASRFFADVRDAVFVDSSLAYDGRNATSETITLGGSTTWDYDELVTLTRSLGGFTALDVGNAIHFTAADGTPLRVTITEYDTTQIVKGFPNRLIPAELRNATTAVWARAVDKVSGLDHLEGKSLAVTGDGYVVASPNNAAYSLQAVVTGGAVTLDQPYGRIRAGLPYTSDLETLDIDTPSGQSLKDTKMLVNRVTAYLEKSRGFFAGQSLPTGADPLELLDEAKVRDASANFGLIELITDTVDVTIPTQWNSNGRVAIRNVDPIPLTVLAIIPRGHLSPTS